MDKDSNPHRKSKRLLDNKRPKALKRNKQPCFTKPTVILSESVNHLNLFNDFKIFVKSKNQRFLSSFGKKFHVRFSLKSRLFQAITVGQFLAVHHLNDQFQPSLDLKSSKN